MSLCAKVIYLTIPPLSTYKLIEKSVGGNTALHHRSTDGWTKTVITTGLLHLIFMIYSYSLQLYIFFLYLIVHVSPSGTDHEINSERLCSMNSIVCTLLNNIYLT